MLIVDDDALMRWSLSEMLAARGYVVTEAGDGRRALTAVHDAAEPFDVVVLDYRLPDSADLRLLERVRTLTPTSQVIVMTSYSSPELTEASMALGAYDVVNKPFEVETVAALVDQARKYADRSDERS